MSQMSGATRTYIGIPGRVHKSKPTVVAGAILLVAIPFMGNDVVSMALGGIYPPAGYAQQVVFQTTRWPRTSRGWTGQLAAR
jgi:hypothetical protein